MMISVSLTRAYGDAMAQALAREQRSNGAREVCLEPGVTFAFRETLTHIAQEVVARLEVAKADGSTAFVLINHADADYIQKHASDLPQPSYAALELSKSLVAEHARRIVEQNRRALAESWPARLLARLVGPR